MQYYEDYVKNVSSENIKNREKPCMKGAYQLTNLRGLLPTDCEVAFLEGMEQFDKIIPGFAGKETILSGIESRTSSPVRIHRDETLQSPAIKGLYPCGEGAGYAGGITCSNGWHLNCREDCTGVLPISLRKAGLMWKIDLK